MCDYDQTDSGIPGLGNKSHSGIACWISVLISCTEWPSHSVIISEMHWLRLEQTRGARAESFHIRGEINAHRGESKQNTLPFSRARCGNDTVWCFIISSSCLNRSMWICVSLRWINVCYWQWDLSSQSETVRTTQTRILPTCLFITWCPTAHCVCWIVDPGW